MKLAVSTFFAIILLGGLWALWSQKSDGNTRRQVMETTTKNNIAITDSSGFVVVELFTSEGCSSCPPADKLLSQIITESKQNGMHIYPIAFHVDYWNSLGWPDRFSSAEYSRRQSSYAKQLSLASIYTPQMVFNGALECTGSNESKVRQYISESLLHSSSTSQPGIILHYIQPKANSTELNVVFEASSYPPDAIINIALIESHLQSDIKRGENSGRILEHDNIVRGFHSFALKAQSNRSVTLEIPSDAVREHLSVLAYIQDRTTLRILAAVK